jgi:hypothetical protein
MGDYSSITCRDVFAHGNVHGLHDVQDVFAPNEDVHGLHDVPLLQKLRTARRNVQHLPVIAESTL